MTRAASFTSFLERSNARAAARAERERQAAARRVRCPGFSDAREEIGREQGPPPFAGWCEPGEILCVRPEPCRKCPGPILVGYLLDHAGDCYGWSTRPLGPCGRPDRCGEKVHGITPEEAFGWRAGR